MADPLNRRQHPYVERALEAFETGAEALEWIAETFEAGERTQQSRTAIKQSGRYDEISIEGVTAQSVAIDYGSDPPGLIVYAEGVRRLTPSDAEMPSHVLELPAADTVESETDTAFVYRGGRS